MFESKEERLETFKRALEAEGYDVVEVEPQRKQTITERINKEADDTIGFAVVETPVEIQGHEFVGELTVTVLKDRLTNHGVDIRSSSDNPLSEEEKALLSDLVPPREVVDDGETYQMWTYYAPPDDLPESVVDGSRDNLDEIVDDLESIYETL